MPYEREEGGHNIAGGGGYALPLASSTLAASAINGAHGGRVRNDDV
jgi:hypothetical protein